MRFLFNMQNHSPMGQRSLEDVIGIIGHQLRALGHEAIWQKDNSQFYANLGVGYNVVVEGFSGAAIPWMANAHAQGARFLIVATEEPTDQGFNHGRDPEMVARQINFPHAAKYADGILHLVPGQRVTDWYSQFAPAAYVELGYARSLVRIKERAPEYDFGFYGSLSPRRLKILKRLANLSGKREAVRVVADFPDQEKRDDEMRKAKVIVQIRKFDEMGLVSSSRCNTAICLGRPVVAEPHELAKPWDEVVPFAKDTEEFYMRALMMRGAWQSIAAGQLEKFQQKFTAAMSVGEPLVKIGVAQHAGYAAPLVEARRAA